MYHVSVLMQMRYKTIQMADKGFDFKELSECKLAVYKKQYCKPAIVKKS